MAHLLAIFPILGAKKFVPKNPALSRRTSYGFVAPCQNLQKTNDKIPRKRLNRWKDGRTDGRMEGQMEGQADPILQDPYGYHWGSNN